PAASEAETASLILPKGKRRETPSVSPPRSLTYLSFREAPRLEPAFIYLSFRIRFSGEESAVQRADRNDSRGAPGLAAFARLGLGETGQRLAIGVASFRAYFILQL